MRSMTREIVRCDAELRKLWEKLQDHGYDPDELANLREDCDLWLDRRNALSNGARGGHRA